MKAVVAAAVVVFSLVIAVSSAVPAAFDGRLDVEWQTFKATYGKSYALGEQHVRRLIWESNVRKIKTHNLDADMGKHTYWLGVNQHADKTHEELRRVMFGAKVPARDAARKDAMTWVAPSNVVLPDSIDWRTQGYVTPIKDQGQCGSSWAFSATGALEGQHFKATGKLVSLSEQNLNDCSQKYGNYGCEGGLMDSSFAYIRDNGGVDTEDAYPYVAADGNCTFDPSKVGATCTGFVDLPQGDENALQVAVATVGPISVAVDSNEESFAYYSHGVYDEPNCSTTNLCQALVVVGYGTLNNQSYWLVKNSWGTSWGMQGYIMMSRNKNNQCGIATVASYPTV